MPRRKRRSVTGLRKQKTPKEATSTASTSIRNTREPATATNPVLQPAPVLVKRGKRIPPEYAVTVLEPQERYILQETIRSKWQVLSEPIQASIMQLFKSVGMPVLAGHEDERWRVEAQVALGSVIRTLGNRLPRMPFPPKTESSHFQYETTLNDIRKLEHRLDPIVHSNVLLEVEIEREEHAIKGEECKLKDIEEQLRIGENIRIQQTAKNYARLPLVGQASPFDSSHKIGLKEHNTSCTLDLMNSDANLQDLIGRIRGHIGSMKNNAEQTVHIQDLISRAETRLGEYLNHQ